MVDLDYQYYDEYSPNKKVKKRLDKIKVDADKVSHREILAILDNEEVYDQESAMSKDEVADVVEKIEDNKTKFSDSPTSRTIKNRLDELAEADIVIKNKSSDPHKFWKRKDEEVFSLSYWYFDESIRKIDPYVRKILYPHTISSVAVILYIIFTLPQIFESFDILQLMILISFYFLGHFAAHHGEMVVD